MEDLIVKFWSKNYQLCLETHNYDNVIGKYNFL